MPLDFHKNWLNMLISYRILITYINIGMRYVKRKDKVSKRIHIIQQTDKVDVFCFTSQCLKTFNNTSCVAFKQYPCLTEFMNRICNKLL